MEDQRKQQNALYKREQAWRQLKANKGTDKMLSQSDYALCPEIKNAEVQTQNPRAQIKMKEFEVNQFKELHKKENARWDQKKSQGRDKQLHSKDNNLWDKQVLQKEECASKGNQQKAKFSKIRNADKSKMDQQKPAFNRLVSNKSEKYLPKSSSKNSLRAFTQGNKNKSKPIKIGLLSSSYSNSEVDPQVQPCSQLGIIIQKYEREIDETKRQLKKHQEQIQLLRKNITMKEQLLLNAISQKSPEIQTYKLIYNNARKNLDQEQKQYQFYMAQLKRLRENWTFLNAKRKLKRSMKLLFQDT